MHEQIAKILGQIKLEKRRTRVTSGYYASEPCYLVKKLWALCASQRAVAGARVEEAGAVGRQNFIFLLRKFTANLKYNIDQSLLSSAATNFNNDARRGVTPTTAGPANDT